MLVAKIDRSAYKVDLSQLHKRVETAHEYMPDDGRGEKEVRLIITFSCEPYFGPFSMKNLQTFVSRYGALKICS